MEIKPIRQNASLVSLSGRKISMSKQVTGLGVDQVKESLLELLEGYEDFVQKHIIDALCISSQDYHRVLQLMEANMARGLDKVTHDKAPVSMDITFVREMPNGTEKGQFLTLDLWGNHFRVLLVTIDGHEPVEVESSQGLIPTKVVDGTGEALFDYIAFRIHKFLERRKLLNTPEPLPLGFTFGFPVDMVALNKAKLRQWTKHIKVDGVVGNDVVQMLHEAIQRKGGMNILIDALVNDTTGTLLTGALEDNKCAIGLVLSKGSNACYIEKLENVPLWEGEKDEPQEVVINTEWHSLGMDGCLDFIRSEYDFAVDEKSLHKGHAIYEKMISGLFLGEIVRLILVKLKENGILYEEHWSEELDRPGRFYTKYVSEVLNEEDIRFKHVRGVLHDVEYHQASETECRVLHHICQLASVRAATLASVGIACILNRMDRAEVGISVEGPLYRFHPSFHDIMMSAIPTFLKREVKFWFHSTFDGSGRGAAIAAAVAERRKKDKLGIQEDVQNPEQTTEEKTYSQEKETAEQDNNEGSQTDSNDKENVPDKGEQESSKT